MHEPLDTNGMEGGRVDAKVTVECSGRTVRIRGLLCIFRGVMDIGVRGPV